MQGKFSENKVVGDEGENVAASHLEGLGFDIVARNVRYKFGEIDIVARRKGELHFIEVKTRRNPRFVPPLEVIDEIKKKRIRRAAEAFLNNRKNFKDNNIPPCFFSVIGVDYAAGEPQIECLFDAFE